MRAAGRGKTVRRSIHLTPFGQDFCDTCLPMHTAELEALGATAAAPDVPAATPDVPAGAPDPTAAATKAPPERGVPSPQPSRVSSSSASTNDS